MRAPLVLVLLAACGEPPVEEGAFEALTYNVAGLPQGLSGSDPAVNTAQIAPLLDAYDVVLVQEDFVYHDDLDAGASHPYRTEWEEPDERPVGDGLNLFSDFPIADVDRVQWVACFGTTENASDCLAEKGFLVAEILLAPDLPLILVNHHAEAGGGPEDVAARAAGFEQMADYVVALGDRAVLVGGDTNLHGNDPDDEPVLAAFMSATDTEDACRTLDCGDEHIDRFLFRSGPDIALSPTSWDVADEFVDPEGEPLSDHPAIHVGFEWHRP